MAKNYDSNSGDSENNSFATEGFCTDSSGSETEEPSTGSSDFEREDISPFSYRHGDWLENDSSQYSAEEYSSHAPGSFTASDTNINLSDISFISSSTESSANKGEYSEDSVDSVSEFDFLPGSEAEEEIVPAPRPQAAAPYSSSDSDSTDEARLLQSPSWPRKMKESQDFSKKAHRKSFLNHLARGDFDKPTVKTPAFRKNKTRQVNDEIAVLNQRFALAFENDTIANLQGSLATEFCVFQFRGIHYSTYWNDDNRREHRKWDEIDKPAFSSSVFKSKAINFGDEGGIAKFKREYQQLKPELLEFAENIKQQLLEFRQVEGYISNKNIYYDNFAYFLQEKYTQDYDGYPELLREVGFEHQGNPFASTGDSPYHSLRYAYGLKAYSGHEDEALIPTWDENGKIKKPAKVGKFYVSEHPLTDFAKDGPLSVPDLLWNGKIMVGNTIAAERETCFPGFIAEDRIKRQFTAKYPSFNKAYKKIYLVKYGLDQGLYNSFKAAIINAANDPAKMKSVAKLLGEWLSAYNQQKIVDWCDQHAAQNGKQAIYRQHHHKFAYELSDATPYGNGNSTPEQRQQATNHKKIREGKVKVKKGQEFTPTHNSKNIKKKLQQIKKAKRKEEVTLIKPKNGKDLSSDIESLVGSSSEEVVVTPIKSKNKKAVIKESHCKVLAEDYFSYIESLGNSSSEEAVVTPIKSKNKKAVIKESHCKVLAEDYFSDIEIPEEDIADKVLFSPIKSVTPSFKNSSSKKTAVNEATKKPENNKDKKVVKSK